MEDNECEYQKKWEKIPQETYPATALLSDLPQEITRKCCPGKTCGNVNLYLVAESKKDMLTGHDSITMEYRRYSNDEAYGYGGSVERLIAFLNDEEYWPDHWDEATGS